MSGIKYYRLMVGEEPPDEFCAVRDANGEPEEYTWYEPMDSFDRELWGIFKGSDWVVASEYRKLNAENAKLRELANGYEALTATLCNERECGGCPFDGTEQIVCEHMRLQTCLSELEIEVDG